MTIIIDRIENDIAVLEVSEHNGTRSEKRIPMAWLPAGARESDVLVRVAHGYAVDAKETQKRRAETIARLEAQNQ